METKDDLILKLGSLRPDLFEMLCCRLLPLLNKQYEGLEPTTNRDGKTTKGVADAYKRLADGNYVVFIFTTQQNQVKDKILKDIEKVATVDGKVAKVVLCLNTPVPIEQDIAYVQAAEKHNWDIDIYSLHTLANILPKHPDLTKEFLNVQSKIFTVPMQSEQVKQFLIGRRLAELRDEIGLQPSEFTELIGFQSEKTYRQMEANEIECGEVEIQQISEATGVLSEWLKHGQLPKYQVDFIGWWREPSDTVQTLTKLSPSFIYVTTVVANVNRNLNIWEKFRDLQAGTQGQYLHTGLLVALSQFQYKIYDLNICLNFWEYPKGEFLAPRFRELMVGLFEQFNFDVRGILIPTWQEAKDLYDGSIHPEKIISKYYDRGTGWVYELTDFGREQSIRNDNLKRYGKWLERVRDELTGHK